MPSPVLLCTQVLLCKKCPLKTFKIQLSLPFQNYMPQPLLLIVNNNANTMIKVKNHGFKTVQTFITLIPIPHMCYAKQIILLILV